MTQLKCPSPGCIYSVPAHDPEAHGWGEHESLFWCPVHSYGEWLRLRRHAEHLAQYTGDTRRREQEVTDLEAEREDVVRRDSARRRDRRHPVSPDEERRTAAQITAIDTRVSFLTRQLQVIKDTRAADAGNFEYENAARVKESEIDPSDK